MAEHATGNSTQRSLLVRVKNPRDTGSWSAFVAVYQPLVYRQCRRHGLQHADAEDVTQQVFVQVSQAIRNFEYHPEKGRFRGWLGKVTRNCIHRFGKKQASTARAAGALEDVLAPEQEAEWTAAFNQHVVHTALSRIRPHFEDATWRAFELTWLQRRSASAAAQTLDRPIDHVYVAKSRVLKRLQQEVQELAEGSGPFGPPDVRP